MGLTDKLKTALTPATTKAREKAEAEARAAGRSEEEVAAAGEQAAKDVRARGTTTGGVS